MLVKDQKNSKNTKETITNGMKATIIRNANIINHKKKTYEIRERHAQTRNIGITVTIL